MEKNRTESITLHAILSLFWSRKWIIVGFSFLFIPIVYFSSRLIQPVFEAQITLLPPTQLNIAAFNIHRTLTGGLRYINAADHYNYFRGILNSPDYQASVLSNFDGLKVQQVFLPFNQSKLSVRGHDAESVKQAIEQLLEKGNQQALDNLNAKALKELELLKKRIEKDKSLITVQRNVELKQKILEEAYQMASSAELENFQPTPVRRDSVVVNSNYLRGKKALLAELKNLQHGGVVPENLLKLEQYQAEYESAKLVLPIQEDVQLYSLVSENIKVREIYSKRKDFMLFSYLIGLLLVCSWIIVRNLNKLSGSTSPNP